MHIFMGGINGSGKSTLLQKVLEQKPDWRVTKNSSAFMEYLGIPGDYEKLRSLDEANRNAMMFDFIDSILTKHANAPHHILDSHYLNLKRGLVDRVTGPWLNKFHAFVLVTAPVEHIFDRIERDHPNRDRALFPEDMKPETSFEMLRAYAERTRQEFIERAKEHNLPHIEIRNDNLDEATQQLVEFVEKLALKASIC